MIIKRIEIENFLSYHGENTMDFDIGPTVIIGQNNTGKSKLFDAFNWVLYDRAFKTEEEVWHTTKEWSELLINNLAKEECKINDFAECSVSLLFYDEDENQYYLTREYRVKKLSSNEWSQSKNSEITLNITTAKNGNNKSYFDKEVDEQIKLLYPENLSKYFLFQGENISQIMSLNNRSAFNKALTDLSRIEVFEMAKRYSEKVFKTLKREFEDKEDSDKVLQERKKSLSDTIQNHKDELITQAELFDNACRERDIAKTVYENKNEELRKFEECAKILQELDNIAKQKESKNELLQLSIESQKKDVFDTWMYAGIETILKNFLKFYNKNKIEKKIPEPIRQEFIKEMLLQKKCKVCGREALEDTTEYLQIKSYLNEKALDKEVELINKLSMDADRMLDEVELIYPDIKEFYKRTEEIEKKINELQTKFQSKEEELRTIKPTEISEDELKSKDFEQLQKDHNIAKSDWEKFKLRIDQISAKRDYIQSQLDQDQKKYDSLVISSSNIIERERLLLAEKVNNNVTQYHTVFLNRLISDIEKEANACFHKMTNKNKALSGKVKVDYANREVYTVDELGNRLQNINQANKVSLQIAFVASILSVSNKFWNTYFPFIADAPISALGGNNKVTAVDTMIDIFNQSIIILKDDAITNEPDNVRNDNIRNMIRDNNNIKNAYELIMKGESIKAQQTQIIKLK